MLDSVSTNKPLNSDVCSTSSSMTHRRRLTSVALSNSNMSNIYIRRNSLLALLLVADQSNEAGAFGVGIGSGVACAPRVASTSTSGSPLGIPASGGLRVSRRRGEGRTAPLQPRFSSLASTTDAGEGVISRRKPYDMNQSTAGNVGQNGTARKENSSQGRQTAPVRVVVNKHATFRAAGGALNGDRAGQGSVSKKSRESPAEADYSILTIQEINKFRRDPKAVRRSVLHHIKTEAYLSFFDFKSLGMGSARHCDIQVVAKVCEAACNMEFKLDVRFMTMLINAASKEQRWVMAVQLLQLMRSYNIEPNNVTYTAILSEMSRFKQHHLVTDMMVTEGLQQSVVAYNALISGCTTRRDSFRAMCYARDMIKEGCQPDAMTCSSLIASTKNGSTVSVEKAFEALNFMKESGVKPDTFCMNSLMGVVLQAVQPNTALEIFKNMEADGIQRDLVSYNCAISACDKLSDGIGAVKVLREASAASICPDQISYNSVMSALGHCSMYKEAQVIFEEIEKAGLKPNLMSYNTLISSYVRAEIPDKALAVFELMKKRGMKPDQYTFAGVLHAYAHLYDYEHSLETIELMVDTGVPPSPESFATATRTCARSGEMGLARYLYALSLSLAIVPNKSTFKSLLEAFSQQKDAEMALWILDEMDELQVEVEQIHLQELVKACFDQTHIVLDALRKVAKLSFAPLPSMYYKSLEVCIQAGSYQAASEVLELMKSVEIEPETEQEKRMIEACFDPADFKESFNFEPASEFEDGEDLKDEIDAFFDDFQPTRR